MPPRPMKPCRRPGCSAVTRDRSGYCEQHQEYGEAKRLAGKREKKTEAFYGQGAWQRFRDWYKSKHPLCEDCEAVGLVVPVYCVDHIVEIKDGGALLSEENARSLCRACHAKKTARVKREREFGGNAIGWIDDIYAMYW